MDLDPALEWPALAIQFKDCRRTGFTSARSTGLSIEDNAAQDVAIAVSTVWLTMSMGASCLLSVLASREAAARPSSSPSPRVENEEREEEEEEEESCTNSAILADNISIVWSSKHVKRSDVLVGRAEEREMQRSHLSNILNRCAGTPGRGARAASGRSGRRPFGSKSVALFINFEK